MGFFSRMFGSKEAKVAAALGAALATEGAMEKAAIAAPHENLKPKVSRVEKASSPEAVFRAAKEAVVNELNETTFDEESGGRLEGKNWKASVKEDGGKLVAEIIVEMGGQEVKKKFELRKDKASDGSDKEFVYSMNTGIDVDEEERERDARATLAKALGKKGSDGGSGPIAMDDGE